MSHSAVICTCYDLTESDISRATSRPHYQGDFCLRCCRSYDTRLGSRELGTVFDPVAYRKAQEAKKKTASLIGRNDPCHCGSGKKFKKCHG